MERTPTTASWRQTVDRATMVSVAFVVAIQLVVCLSAIGHAWPSWPDSDLVRVLLVAAGNLIVLVTSLALARDPDADRILAAGRPLIVVALIGLAAAGGLAAPSPLPESALQIVPVNSIQTVQIAVIGFSFAWRSGAAVIILSGPLYIALREAAAGSSALGALDEWVLPAGTSLAVLAVLQHLRAGADSADRLAAAAHRASVATAARANADLAREEARRVLHDDVISALRAAELGLDASQVRRAAASALESLHGADPRTSLAGLEAHLRRAAPLEVTIDAGRWQQPPPPRVLAALRDAAAEALRNAARHGEAERADVVLTSTARRTEVVVTDHGRGLAPGWRMGFGVRESIIARLTGLAGEATVAPADGGGTTVRLAWPAGPESPERTALPVVPDRGPALRLVGVSCAATTLYTALRFPGEAPWSSLAVAAVILAFLVAAVARVVRVRSGGPMAWGPLVLVGGTLSGVVWLGLLAAGDGALLSVRSWVVGSVSNIVALLAFDVPARRIAPVIAALVATVALFAWRDPSVRLVDPLGAYATPLVVAGLAALLGSAMRHGERLILRRGAELAVQTEAQAWEGVTVAVRGRHLTHLEQDVVPFLEQVVATGTADPDQARILAAGCRDELYLERPLDPDTRIAVQAARKRGVSVVLRPGRHEPALAWPTLRAVLEVAGAGHAVTVLPADDGSAGRVVVTPALDVRVGHHVEHDAVRSVFTLGPSRPSPSLLEQTGPVR